MAENGRLTGRQQRALLALLSESTVQAAAKTAGIGERTLFRWLREPDFQEAYRQARREAVSRAIGRLQQAASQAVDALESIISDPAAPASARVSAARVVLELAVKVTEVEDLTERVKQLEEVVNG